MIHNFGLPDLNDNSGEFIGRGLGHYSIMSNRKLNNSSWMRLLYLLAPLNASTHNNMTISTAYGVNNLANSPSHLTPHEKVLLGWLVPIEIETDGRYELRDSETSTDVYVIKRNFQFLDDEYFLIENRQPKLFDEDLWEGGIMIWHIDDTKIWMRERGFPGQIGTF